MLTKPPVSIIIIISLSVYILYIHYIPSPATQYLYDRLRSIRSVKAAVSGISADGSPPAPARDPRRRRQSAFASLHMADVGALLSRCQLCLENAASAAAASASSAEGRESSAELFFCYRALEVSGCPLSMIIMPALHALSLTVCWRFVLCCFSCHHV
jgi:hypothetical protein